MQPLKSYLTKEGWSRDCRETFRHIERLAARLASYPLFFPPVMGTEWYQNNGYFRFKIDDVIERIDSDEGSGDRRRFKVVGFEYGDGSVADHYFLEWELPLLSNQNLLDAIHTGRIPEDTEKVKMIDHALKGDIELYFMKAFSEDFSLQ